MTGMDVFRSKTIWMFHHFGENSIGIIARLLHVDDIDNFTDMCHDLVNEGVLVQRDSEDIVCGLDTFYISDIGKEMIPDHLPPVNPTRWTLYYELYNKQTQICKLRNIIIHGILSNRRCLTILQILDEIQRHHSNDIPSDFVNIRVIQSALYFFMSRGIVLFCDPLYIVPKIKK